MYRYNYEKCINLHTYVHISPTKKFCVNQFVLTWENLSLVEQGTIFFPAGFQQIKEWMDTGKWISCLNKYVLEKDSSKWYDRVIETCIHIQRLLMILEIIFYFTCGATWRGLYMYEEWEGTE